MKTWKAILLAIVPLTIAFPAIYFISKTQKEEKANVKKLMRDYQIELHIDTVWIYDGDRLVGRYVSNRNTSLDSLIMKDNQ
jgi:hypothetical protein